jgi:hypothetical protein
MASFVPGLSLVSGGADAAIYAAEGGEAARDARLAVPPRENAVPWEEGHRAIQTV